MSEQPPRYNAIEPALSAADAEILAQYSSRSHVGGRIAFIENAARQGEWHKIIAVANSELPASDPRKITRAGLLALRADAEELRKRSSNGDDALFLIAWRMSLMADALASYLPPE